MNNVMLPEMKTETITLRSVTGDRFRSDKTAFIGKLNTKYEVKLFLVSYQGVIEAGNPGATCSGAAVTFEVIRWVDIDISVAK